MTHQYTKLFFTEDVLWQIELATQAYLVLNPVVANMHQRTLKSLDADIMLKLENVLEGIMENLTSSESDGYFILHLQEFIRFIKCFTCCESKDFSCLELVVLTQYHI